MLALKDRNEPFLGESSRSGIWSYRQLKKWGHSYEIIQLVRRYVKISYRTILQCPFCQGEVPCVNPRESWWFVMRRYHPLATWKPIQRSERPKKNKLERDSHEWVRTNRERTFLDCMCFKKRLLSLHFRLTTYSKSYRHTKARTMPLSIEEL